MTGHTAEFVLEEMPLHIVLGYAHAWGLKCGATLVWPEVKQKVRGAILDQMESAFTGPA